MEFESEMNTAQPTGNLVQGSAPTIDTNDFYIEPSEILQCRRPPRSSPRSRSVEDICMYKKGGYHPVKLNDYLDWRYVIMHKLGHGRSSTVWLCWDNDERTLVAVKILTADKSSESNPELQVKRHFREKCRTELEFNQIFIPLEHFWINGPNGRHLCLVTQLLGPPLSQTIPDISMETPGLLKDLCYQASMALCYLHRKGVCHGDFRPEKLMMQLDHEAMSGRDMKKYLGPIVTHPSESQSTDSHEALGKPSYLVEPADLRLLERTFRTGIIAVIGLGQASLARQQPQPQRFDWRYAAPEMLTTRKRDEYATDMWSLACTIYTIRTQGQLMAPVDSMPNLLGLLGWAFGPIPPILKDGLESHLPQDYVIQEKDGNDKFELRKFPGDKEEQKRTDRHYLPRDWGKYRHELNITLSPEGMLDTHGRPDSMPTILPKDWRKWRKVRQQREKYTGYPTILHEDLSRERTFYEQNLPEPGVESLDSSEDEGQEDEREHHEPPNPGEWTPPRTPPSEWERIEDFRESDDKDVQEAFTREELRILDELDRHSIADTIRYRAGLLQEWEDNHHPRQAKLKEGVREQIDALNLRADYIRVFTPEHTRVSAKLMDMIREKRKAKKAAREAAELEERQRIEEEGSKEELDAEDAMDEEEQQNDGLTQTQIGERLNPSDPAAPSEEAPSKGKYDHPTDQQQELKLDELDPDHEKSLVKDEHSKQYQGEQDQEESYEEQHNTSLENTGQEATIAAETPPPTPRDTIWPKDLDTIQHQARRPSSETHAGAKRPLAEIDWKQWEPTGKRPRMEFLLERTSRDQIERVEQPDGRMKTAYRLQKEEVGQLADLLNKMLKNDPKDRIGFPEVLRHKWFGDRWKCMVGSIHALHVARNWPG